MVSKPVLMLLPGLMCDRRVWVDQIDALSHAWECRVPDYEAQNDLGAMADIVLAQAPEQFAMAGHSMGGRVALEVMRRAPERVLRLALLDTGHTALAPGEAGEKEIAGRMRLVTMAKEEGMRAMGREWLQGMVHPARLHDRDLCDRILDMIESKTPAMFEGQIHALIHRPDATEVLRSIDCPTTFICGRDDAWSTLEKHYEMAELVKYSKVVPIENSGHMSTMEQPGDMSRELLGWLG
ncbi:MAG: alpha/beta fold hydrolase [Saccharospirillum sp.]